MLSLPITELPKEKIVDMNWTENIAIRATMVACKVRLKIVEKNKQIASNKRIPKNMIKQATNSSSKECQNTHQKLSSPANTNIWVT